MRWACCMFLFAVLLNSAIPWGSSPFTDARSLRSSTHQTLTLPGSESRKWYPISGAIIAWSRVAQGEGEAEERHPAEKLLRRQKVDMTESYILGGYK
eukprot:c20171_g1_i1 orf=91-381(+)